MACVAASAPGRRVRGLHCRCGAVPSAAGAAWAGAACHHEVVSPTENMMVLWRMQRRLGIKNTCHVRFGRYEINIWILWFESSVETMRYILEIQHDGISVPQLTQFKSEAIPIQIFWSMPHERKYLIS